MLDAHAQTHTYQKYTEPLAYINKTHFDCIYSSVIQHNRENAGQIEMNPHLTALKWHIIST